VNRRRLRDDGPCPISTRITLGHFRLICIRLPFFKTSMPTWIGAQQNCRRGLQDLVGRSTPVSR
jgi:hypothetical protein